MSINWSDVFEAVCNRANGALEWGLPEPWVHAELYSELKRNETTSGWRPLQKEVPYVTFYPVCLPQKTNRVWESHGGVKWADLCLHHKKENAWCWFEFKVRHTRKPDPQQKAAKQARDAFRKDVIGLVGFDRTSTAEIWKQPDKFTNAYWFKDLLGPNVSEIQSGKHIFVSAYLQLSGTSDPTVWSEEIFRKELKSWLAHRQKYSHRKGVLQDIGIKSYFLAEGHSLLMCEWTVENKDDSKS